MFSKFFIERPIFAAVVSIVLCLAGAVAWSVLPVEQYPTITPVQVTVNAIYPGADSKTLADSVAAPIEAQINGVDNMLYMSSTSSSNGILTLTVYFSLDTDPDVAQVQVQNRVNLAVPSCRRPSCSRACRCRRSLLDHDAHRHLLEGAALQQRVHRELRERLRPRRDQAGARGRQSSIMGIPDQAMRVWMNPTAWRRSGSRRATSSARCRAERALRRRVDRPAADGRQGGADLPRRHAAAVHEPSDYENIILRAGQGEGAIVRLKDVARVEVGLRQYVLDSRLNGLPATFVAVYQQRARTRCRCPTPSARRWRG